MVVVSRGGWKDGKGDQRPWTCGTWTAQGAGMTAVAWLRSLVAVPLTGAGVLEVPLEPMALHVLHQRYHRRAGCCLPGQPTGRERNLVLGGCTRGCAFQFASVCCCQIPISPSLSSQVKQHRMLCV